MQIGNPKTPWILFPWNVCAYEFLAQHGLIFFYSSLRIFVSGRNALGHYPDFFSVEKGPFLNDPHVKKIFMKMYPERNAYKMVVHILVLFAFTVIILVVICIRNEWLHHPYVKYIIINECILCFI